jgi:hypothetical protein
MGNRTQSGDSKALYRTDLFVTMILALVLLLFFTYVLADHFTSSPSPGISRELYVGEVEMAPYGVFRDHIAAFPGSETGTLTVAAVDGTSMRIFYLDDLGHVRDEKEFAVNLSYDSRIAGYTRSDGALCLFAGDRELRRFVIDPSGDSLTEEILLPGIQDFVGSGPMLMAYGPEGLWGWNDELGVRVGLIAKIDIERAAAARTDGGLLTALVQTRDTDHFDVRLLGFDSDFNITTDRFILQGTADDRFRHLRDIRVQDGTVFLLFTRRDTKYGQNEITMLQIPQDADGENREYQSRVPLRNGRFQFVDYTVDAPPPFLFRWNTVFGSNLALGTWTFDNDRPQLDVAPLTKTRPLSVLDSFLNVGANRMLVFSDIVENRRTIFIASNDPNLVTSTTHWFRADWGGVVSTALLHGILALFFGVVAFMVAASPALLLVYLFDRLRVNIRYRKPILTAVGVVVYTGFLLFVTRFFLLGTMRGRFTAPGFGEAPMVYWFVSALSVLSYLLSLPRYSNSVVSRDPATIALVRVLALNMVLYSMGFMIYGVTAMLIGKI